MSIKEKELYEPVRAALERSFAAIGKTVVCETAATKGLGEPLKALIPPEKEILFSFLKNPGRVRSSANSERQRKSRSPRHLIDIVDRQAAAFHLHHENCSSLSLQTGGRLVGIITHIEELSRRLPSRLVVHKHSDGSQVEIQSG
jgi:hypothetical protein